jgi:hypothetical protein
VIPEDVIRILNHHVGSLWALELILLMRRTREREWSPRALDRELRASPGVIGLELPLLVVAGIVRETEPGKYRYEPASAELDATVERLATCYRDFPVATVRHVASHASNRSLLAFLEAFRFRSD